MPQVEIMDDLGTGVVLTDWTLEPVVDLEVGGDFFGCVKNPVANLTPARLLF
jgi:hypothetical protein